MEYCWVPNPKIFEKDLEKIKDILQREMVEAYRRVLPASVGERCTSVRVYKLVRVYSYSFLLTDKYHSFVTDLGRLDHH